MLACSLVSLNLLSEMFPHLGEKTKMLSVVQWWVKKPHFTQLKEVTDVNTTHLSPLLLYEASSSQWAPALTHQKSNVFPMRLSSVWNVTNELRWKIGDQNLKVFVYIHRCDLKMWRYKNKIRRTETMLDPASECCRSALLFKDSTSSSVHCSTGCVYSKIKPI